MASIKRKKITALIPCYNEAGGIAAVINNFPFDKIDYQGFDLEIVVIDNNSSDSTPNIARSLGVTVLHEPIKGKGNAMRRGFNYALSNHADYIVMLDGDDTYRSKEILRLIEPLDSGFCDVVVGSRLGGRIHDGSMTTFNRMGNWVFSHLVRYFYQVNVTDVLTGYFAWTKKALKHLAPNLKSQGFAIEMEMVTKMARLGEEIYSVPISYDKRAGETNLNPVYDGARILWMFAKNLVWNAPLQSVQRIVFVSDAIMPYNKGGKERRLYEITKRLVREGREVHIYTMKWWDGPFIIEHNGVYFHAISKLYPLYNGGHRSIKQAIMFGLATFKLIFVDFDVLDVDHMPFFPLFSARIVTWLKGKKLQATWHEVWGYNYWMHYLKGLSGFIGYIIERTSLLMPDTIISNSEHTTGRLKSAGFNGIIQTIPLGVDVPRIKSVKKASDKSDVIFVGRLLENKNADLLVKAIALVKYIYPNVICKIVGDGPEKDNIEGLIRRLGLEQNIHITSFVAESDELYSLMKASKMLVLPSIREGFGLVVVEANAAGIPVITTSHEDNAARHLIQEGSNGLLADASMRSIAEKIIKIMRNENKMQPKKDIEKYDWPVVVQRVEQVIGPMP